MAIARESERRSEIKIERERETEVGGSYLISCVLGVCLCEGSAMGICGIVCPRTTLQGWVPTTPASVISITAQL